MVHALLAQPIPVKSGAINYPHLTQGETKKRTPCQPTVIRPTLHASAGGRPQRRNAAKWGRSREQGDVGHARQGLPAPLRAQNSKRGCCSSTLWRRYGRTFPQRRRPTFIAGKPTFSVINDGLQRAVRLLRLQKGVGGAPRGLSSIHKLSEDGTTALSLLALDKTGKYAAYATSQERRIGVTFTSGMWPPQDAE